MSGRLFSLIFVTVLFVSGCTTTVTQTTDYEVTDGTTASVVDTRLKKLHEESLKYPKRSDLHYQMALLYFQQAQYHESREALEKATEMEPRK